MITLDPVTFIVPILISHSISYFARWVPFNIPHLAARSGRRSASLPSNLRATSWRRLPAVALAKAGRRFGWQAGPRLRPQAQM